MSLDETEERYVKLKLSEYKINIPKYLCAKKDRNLLSIYSCSRCNEIALEPKTCKTCNSLICQNCIDKITDNRKINEENIIMCLDCNNPLNLTEIQKITRKGLEMLHVKCLSDNINCFNEFELNHLYNHLENCKYFEGKSKCKACGLIDWTKNIKTHVINCVEFEGECKYCQESFQKKNLFDHEKSCFKRPKICKTCSSLIHEENINLHPTKDVCMMNLMNEVKIQIEKKIDYMINANKERDEKIKLIDVISEDLKNFKEATYLEMEEIRKKADKTDKLDAIEENIQKLYIQYDTTIEKLNFNSSEIQKINVVLLDYNAQQQKRDVEIKEQKRKIDECYKKIKDLQNDINYQDEFLKNLKKTIEEKDGKIFQLNEVVQNLKNNMLDRDKEFQEIRAKLEQNMKAISNIADPKFIRDLKSNLEDNTAKIKFLDEKFLEIKVNLDKTKEETIEKITKNIALIDNMSSNVNVKFLENQNKLKDIDTKMVDLDTYIKDMNKKFLNNTKNKGKVKLIDKQIESYSCVKTLSGHSHYVNCVIFSQIDKETKYIVTGSGDNTIKLWDVDSGLSSHTLEGHNAGVFALIKIKWDFDNSTIASGSADKTIKLWNLSTFEEIKTISGHAHAVYCLARIKWEKDQTTIASGSGDYTIKIWNIESGLCLKTLAAHSNIVVSIKQIRWNRDEHTLVSGSWDNKIYVWDFAKGICIKALTGHTHWVSSVLHMKMEDDEYCLVSGSYDYTIRIWNLNSGVSVKTLEGHTADVLCLFQIKWAKDEHTFISGSADKTIKFWNIQSGVCFKTLLRHNDPVFCLVQIKINEDQTTIVSGSGDYSIKLWS